MEIRNKHYIGLCVCIFVFMCSFIYFWLMFGNFNAVTITDKTIGSYEYTNYLTKNTTRGTIQNYNSNKTYIYVWSYGVIPTTLAYVALIWLPALLLILSISLFITYKIKYKKK